MEISDSRGFRFPVLGPASVAAGNVWCRCRASREIRTALASAAEAVAAGPAAGAAAGAAAAVSPPVRVCGPAAPAAIWGSATGSSAAGWAAAARKEGDGDRAGVGVVEDGIWRQEDIRRLF